jgi:phosphoribosyl-ATP pyrophosphohydrolase
VAFGESTGQLASPVRGWDDAMTFEEMVKLAAERKKAGTPAGSTTTLLKAGTHAIGKKLAEEAAEAWMAARFESKDQLALELSQLLYHVAVMMADKDVSLEEVYKKL